MSYHVLLVLFQVRELTSLSLLFPTCDWEDMIKSTLTLPLICYRHWIPSILCYYIIQFVVLLPVPKKPLWFFFTGICELFVMTLGIAFLFSFQNVIPNTGLIQYLCLLFPDCTFRKYINHFDSSVILSETHLKMISSHIPKSFL